MSNKPRGKVRYLIEWGRGACEIVAVAVGSSAQEAVSIWLHQRLQSEEVDIDEVRATIIGSTPLRFRLKPPTSSWTVLRIVENEEVVRDDD